MRREGRVDRLSLGVQTQPSDGKFDEEDTPVSTSSGTGESRPGSRGHDAETKRSSKARAVSMSPNSPIDAEAPEDKPEPLRPYPLEVDPQDHSADINVVCEVLSKQRRGERAVETDALTAVTMPFQLLSVLSLAIVALLSLGSTATDDMRDRTASFCSRLCGQGDGGDVCKKVCGSSTDNSTQPKVLRDLSGAVVTLSLDLTLVVIFSGAIVVPITLWMSWVTSEKMRSWASRVMGVVNVLFAFAVVPIMFWVGRDIIISVAKIVDIDEEPNRTQLPKQLMLADSLENTLTTCWRGLFYVVGACLFVVLVHVFRERPVIIPVLIQGAGNRRGACWGVALGLIVGATLGTLGGFRLYRSVVVDTNQIDTALISIAGLVLVCGAAIGAAIGALDWPICYDWACCFWSAWCGSRCRVQRKSRSCRTYSIDRRWHELLVHALKRHSEKLYSDQLKYAFITRQGLDRVFRDLLGSPDMSDETWKFVHTNGCGHDSWALANTRGCDVAWAAEVGGNKCAPSPPVEESLTGIGLAMVIDQLCKTHDVVDVLSVKLPIIAERWGADKRCGEIVGHGVQELRQRCGPSCCSARQLTAFFLFTTWVVILAIILGSKHIVAT